MRTFYRFLFTSVRRTDIFHSNVDRLFAIWQTLNPTVWFSDKDQQLPDDDGNWSTPPKTIDTPSTPLAPFHTDTCGTTYTSDEVRDWTKLGYSYPELQPWLPKYIVDCEFSQEAYLNDVKKQLNNLYSSTRHMVLKTHPAGVTAPRAVGTAPRSQVTAPQQVLAAAAPQQKAQVSHDDYVVNVMYKKYVPFSFSLIGKKFC
jgi:tyrosinase